MGDVETEVPHAQMSSGDRMHPSCTPFSYMKTGLVCDPSQRTIADCFCATICLGNPMSFLGVAGALKSLRPYYSQ